MPRVYFLQCVLLYIVMASIIIGNDLLLAAQEDKPKIYCNEADGSCPTGLSCNLNFNDPLKSCCE